MPLSALPIEERIGISTLTCSATHGEDIYDAIRLAHGAGFSGFEIVPSVDQGYIGYPVSHPSVGIDLLGATQEDIDRLREAVSVFSWVTVHSPHLGWNLGSVNRHLRRLTREYYDKCFEFAVELGAVAMTFHQGTPTYGYKRSDEELWGHNRAYAEHLMPKATAAAMPVGFEAGSLASLKYVCDRVPGWGINLDIGHAYMSAGTDAGFLAYLDELGASVVEVHHNGVNHYWHGLYMEHQPPHLNNTIDFQTTYERLRDSGYAGPIIAEIGGQDIAQVLRNCQESKEMIVGIWNGTRPLAERWNVAV